MRRTRSLVLSMVAAVVAAGLTLHAVSPASAAATTATFAKVSDWGSGWQGEYTITNGGTSALTWRVEFDLPSGTTMGSYWDALLTSSGQHHTFTGRSWNASVAPGATAKFGFIGTGTGAPTGCKLNGVSCTGTTTPTTPPTTTPPTGTTPITAIQECNNAITSLRWKWNRVQRKEFWILQWRILQC